ncbi:MAG TPA: divergent polysaccharide deacetylase family protein [bacterium]|nr:divergent polysaccharide deacetylase family protein [bacterium]
MKKKPEILPPETKEEPALIKEEKKTEEKQPAKKKSKSFSGKKPRIALIIDDVGWNKEIVKEIEKINQPFTLAFLPKAQHSKEIFDSVKDNKNFDLLLHLPLEPSPPAQSFDKGLLKTSMDSQELIEQFNDDIDYYYPYIKGINNHMGSLFTTDEEKMKILLKEIKERNLFFIDSMTSRKSCGYLIAKDMGVKSGKRDVFIDNLSDHKYIEDQIWELVESAREKGSAIGIGHARKNTVAVLKNIMPSLTEQVEIVPVSELIE